MILRFKMMKYIRTSTAHPSFIHIKRETINSYSINGSKLGYINLYELEYLNFIWKLYSILV